MMVMLLLMLMLMVIVMAMVNINREIVISFMACLKVRFIHSNYYSVLKLSKFIYLHFKPMCSLQI